VGDVGPAAVGWSLDAGAQVHGLYQQLLASLAEAGVLLAAATKNEPGVVEQAFAREDIGLGADRVYPIAATWGAKSESVREILRIWNVGADAVVFVDDNALELAEVARAFPAMDCVLFPKNDPNAVWALLGDLRDRFGRPEVVDEDRYRLASIRSSGAAPLDPGAIGTPDELLAELGGELTLDWSKNAADARPLQLVNKTNQFNLNGRRLDEAAWLTRLRDPSQRVIVASYRDRFGPLGRSRCSPASTVPTPSGRTSGC
jgi:FkbH-like protein